MRFRLLGHFIGTPLLLVLLGLAIAPSFAHEQPQPYPGWNLMAGSSETIGAFVERTDCAKAIWTYAGEHWFAWFAGAEWANELRWGDVLEPERAYWVYCEWPELQELDSSNGPVMIP